MITNTEAIKAAARLDQIIGQHVALKKEGRNFLGLCPFHDEKSPSFTVSPAKGIYKCFGCDESGDVFAFIRKIERKSFTEAVRAVAERSGIGIEETGGNLNQQAPKEYISDAEIHTAELWIVGYRHALEARKAKLSAALLKCMERDADPDPSLAAELKDVTVLLAATEDLRQPRQLVEAYRRHLSVKPTLTEKIVQDEAKWQNTIARALGV